MRLPFSRPLRATAVLLLLTLPSLAFPQKVTVPAEVKVPTGRLGSVLIEYDGDDCKWATDSGLDVFREYDPDAKKVRLKLIGYIDGTYKLQAITVKGGKLSEFAVCTVVVGTPAPPGPTPTPTPTPVPDPDPFGKNVKGGNRCLVVYERSEESKLPPEQQRALYTTVVRNYLNEKCAVGPDGTTREWNFWDKDVDVSGADPVWQKVMKLPRTTLPWIIIGNGKTGYSGPLPKTIPEIQALLKKYFEGGK